MIGRDDGGVFVHDGSGWTPLRGGGVRFYDGTLLATTLPGFNQPLGITLFEVRSPPGSCSN